MAPIGVARRLRTSRLHDRLTLLRELYPELRLGWDVTGLAVLAGLLGTVLLAGVRTGSPVSSVAGLIGACAGCAFVGTLLGIRHRAIVPAVVVTAVAGLLWDFREELLLGPISGPFDYRNATGALLFQGALGCLIAGFAFRNLAARLISLLPAAAFGVLAVRSSAATAAGLALVAITLLALAGRRGTRAAVVMCGTATALVLTGTVWLGLAYQPGQRLTGPSAAIADAGITERRFALWHDATAIIAEHPGGIGHGAFGTTSPTALSDRDTIYVHQEFLEQTAELGWAAGALLILLVVWAFGRLVANPRADAVTALAAVAFAGLLIQAGVDYVLHFPAVPMAASALLGTGIAAPRDEYEDW